MKKAIITGVTGQDGAYLSKLLLEKGYKVYGAYRRISHPVMSRLEYLGIQNDVEMVDFELTEENNVNRVIRAIEPDELYNLAAQSFVGSSWEQPYFTTDANAVGVLRVLEALRMFSPHTRFYQASTSEMFGKVRAVPQNEETPFYPRSPYGVSKTFGHFITINYRESFGLHASSGILFNHESPLRGKEFVTRKITLGLARMAHGSDQPIVLGNLDAKRDWGFAGDYVEGMWLMMQQEKADDYVLATGATSSIRDFILYASANLGMEIEFEGSGTEEIGIDRNSGRKIIEVSKEFYRPAEVEVLLGDPSKAREKLGWQPQVDIKELAKIMMNADFTRMAPSAV
ncbi:MAG: GDP-mannose 4,6-dehydratase [Pseudomonadota bacterium]